MYRIRDDLRGLVRSGGGIDISTTQKNATMRDSSSVINMEGMVRSLWCGVCV